MFRYLSRRMLTGLITVVPIMLSLYCLYWFVVTTESLLGDTIKWILPEHFYWPGMGFIAAMILVLVIGILMQLYVVKILFSHLEKVFFQLPLLKTLYGSFRDFFQYFSPNRQSKFEQVVAFELENGIEMLGLITLETLDDLPVKKPDDDERVLVYLPMSYNLGGYPIMIAKSRLRKIDMSMEQAMRFILTAGVAGSNAEESK
jgi:uncharacterized membrane protein